MVINSSLKILLTLLLALSLSHCGRSPKQNFFVLNPIQNSAKKIKNQSLRIGLESINLPEYLQKPQIALRQVPNKIIFDEENRWAEQVDKNIARVIQTDLNHLLKHNTVAASPWPGGFNPSHRLHITISRFDVSTNGDSVLLANYQLLDNNGEKTLYSQSVNYRNKLNSLEPNQVVASMNRQLNRLSHQIARSIIAKL